jgi:TLC domain
MSDPLPSWGGPLLQFTSRFPFFTFAPQKGGELDSNSGSSGELDARAVVRKMLRDILIGWGVSAAAHLLGRLLVRRFLREKGNQQEKTTKNGIDVLYLSEVVPSTLHALLLGVGGIYYHFVRQLWRSDLLLPQTAGIDRILALSAGYQIHDMLVMFLHGDSFDMWAHHVLAAGGGLVMVVYRLGSFVPCMFWVSELTVLPQNALYVGSQLLGRERFERTAVFNALLYARLAAHTLFRVGLGPICLWRARATGLTPSRLADLPPFFLAAIAWQLTAFQVKANLWSRVTGSSQC